MMLLKLFFLIQGRVTNIIITTTRNELKNLPVCYEHLLTKWFRFFTIPPFLPSTDTASLMR